MTSGTPEIRLFNTLTKSREPFVPIDAKNVRMYVCGPTVYDFAHIGNARPAIVFDVLYRLLRHTYGEDHVTYVRNITDVDDKINARAVRDFPGEPLNEAIAKVTEKTATQYHSDMKALGCLEPTHEPRATAHIEGMIKMIQALIDKGNAYVALGEEGTEVLFDTRSMPEYGRLSRRNLDEQKAGARVAVEEHKKNPADFVLWKQSTDDQPGWDGAFTFESNTHTVKGRPGWHIECSVMAEALLGERFDIHGGGLDLIFPHHENEIAQSRCAHGTEAMANVWMHNGFLQVEGEKMSKSLGNFYTVDELLSEEKFGGRTWPGPVLRLAMLMTHYREPIDFSQGRLGEAFNKANDLITVSMEFEHGLADPDALDLLSDDLNTVELIKYAQELRNKLVHGVGENVGSKLRFTLDLLGVPHLSAPSWLEMNSSKGRLTTSDVAAKRDERLTALANKDFATADKIRDKLAADGIQLKDYKDPETGERKTKWEVKR